MKVCQKCGSTYDDSMSFCVKCGTPLNAAAGGPAQQNYAAQGVVNSSDHTAQFSPEDIAANKFYATLPYLGGVGIIIALLLNRNSGFLKFHIDQGVKFFFINSILTIVSVALSWTIIVPCLAPIAGCIVFVIQVISFFQAMSGKAKEPAILKDMNFMK